MIAEEFGVTRFVNVDLRPRYNVAPSQLVETIIRTGDEKRLGPMRWGFIPEAAKDPKLAPINARAETLATSPMFRDAFRRHRCLVVADGFYEWRKDGRTKTPFFIRLRSGRPFAFAGIWSLRRSEAGARSATCVLATCPPNELMATIHNRMPVILPPGARDRWLDPPADLGESWEDRAGEGIEEGSLLGRREHYGPDLPAGVCVVTAGVDVQDDRLELELLGWGLGEECWSLSFLTIRADPSTAVPWRELDDILLRPLRRVDGVELRVAATRIDSGGHFSQAVAAFARERCGRRVWATKGLGGARPIWPRRPSKNNVNSVNLFLIGVDSAKELVYARLKVTKPGPACCHWPEHYDEEYFAQLTAEKVVTK